MQGIIHFLLFIPFVLALLVPFVLVMSSSQSKPPPVYLNQPFTLHQFNQITLTDSTAGISENLVLTLENILDSRCPDDVLCIQAGTAEVDLSLSTPSGESATIHLNVGGNKFITAVPGQGNRITLGGKTYLINVLSVAPYPTATGMQLSKHASLVVARI